jgi:hypothetical protein
MSKLYTSYKLFLENLEPEMNDNPGLSPEEIAHEAKLKAYAMYAFDKFKAAMVDYKANESRFVLNNDERASSERAIDKLGGDHGTYEMDGTISFILDNEIEIIVPHFVSGYVSKGDSGDYYTPPSGGDTSDEDFQVEDVELRGAGDSEFDDYDFNQYYSPEQLKELDDLGSALAWPYID